MKHLIHSTIVLVALSLVSCATNREVLYQGKPAEVNRKLCLDKNDSYACGVYASQIDAMPIDKSISSENRIKELSEIEKFSKLACSVRKESCKLEILAKVEKDNLPTHWKCVKEKNGVACAKMAAQWKRYGLLELALGVAEDSCLYGNKEGCVLEERFKREKSESISIAQEERKIQLEERRVQIEEEKHQQEALDKASKLFNASSSQSVPPTPKNCGFKPTACSHTFMKCKHVCINGEWSEISQ